MSELKYTKDHEWIRLDGDIATVGITEYAQNALGDVVYVEVPEAGAALTAGAEAGVIELVKAASEIYAPATGEVVEGNPALADDPSLVNTAPTGDGWMFKVKLSNAAEVEGLMTEAEYNAYTEGLD